MPTVKKLDSKRRVVFPDTFAPGDVFIEESQDEGKITFSLVASAESAVADTVMEGGQLILDSSLSREVIQKAVRIERDRR